MNDLDYNPCDDCSCSDWCDSWEAMFCFTLCQADNEYPDCDNCDRYDI